MAGRDIPEDIVIEILKRLPVKSVFRFRCVCKSWHSTISDQQFVRLHQKRSALLIVSTNYKDHQIQFKTLSYQALASAANNSSADLSNGMEYYDIPPSCPTHFTFKGSCNGLLCLADYRNTYLWNPATRDFKSLPPAYTELYPFSYKADYLDLCFDRSTDDYKIVATSNVARTPSVFRHRKYITLKTKIGVFSLKKNAWTRVPPDNVFSLSTRIGFAVFLNGANHWLAAHVNVLPDRDDDDGVYILAFDLAEEKLQVLPKPDMDISDDSHLAVVGECICIYFSSRESISLWMMKEYGMKESWTKLLAVPCQPAELSSFSFWPFCFLPDGDVLGTCGPTKLLRCNVQKQSVEPMSFLDNDGKNRVSIDGHVETLYPITQQNNQALL